MLITKIDELILKTKGKNKNNPVEGQTVKIKCDICGKIVKTKYYTYINQLKLYNECYCNSCRLKKEYSLGLRKEQSIAAGEGYSKKYKGKKIEEILGENKGKNFRKKMSLRNSGKNNPNFGGKYSHGFGDRIEWNKQTFIEKYGKEKSGQIKKKLSNASIGKNNSMYGKPAPNGAGNGWQGWYKGIFFRSLLELSAMVYFEKNKIKFESAEKKKYSVNYINEYDNTNRIYFPDFYLSETEEIVEIKPEYLINSKNNKSKFSAAKEKYGNKFKILTEKNIKRLTFDEIIIIFNNGQLLFMEKYNNLFKEKYL